MLVPIGGVLSIVAFALWIWALITCITVDPERVRTLPKWAWIVIVVLLGAIGAILWLLLGRPRGADRRESRSVRSQSVAPRARGRVETDADRPEISDRRSAELDRQLAQWEARQTQQSAARPSDGTGPVEPPNHPSTDGNGSQP